MEELKYYCPELTGKIDRARGWTDLYTVSKERTAPAWFKRYLRVSQISQAYIDLGLPSQFVLTAHNAVELEKYALSLDSISSRVPLGIEPKTMLPDLITVRVDYRNTTEPDALAYCHAWKGLISLTPNFFQDSTLLVSCPIAPGVTKFTDLVTMSRVTTFMHEVYHVSTVLSAKDEVLCEEEILRSCTYQDPIEVERQKHCLSTMLEPGSGIEIPGRTIGWVKCLGLRILDEQNDTIRAEGNAETWAIYGNIRLLIYTYPELDFLSGPVVVHRKTMLHHFSAFNILRHPDSVMIQDLPDYNVEKDLWVQKKGKRTPNTIKALLNQLIAMYNMHGPGLDDLLREAGLGTGQDNLTDALKEKLHI